MKEAAIMLAFGLTFVTALGIGAYLVVHGHPWFALLVMVIAASISFKTGDAAKR